MPDRGIAPPYFQVMSLTWKPKTTHPVRIFYLSDRGQARAIATLHGLEWLRDAWQSGQMLTGR